MSRLSTLPAPPPAWLPPDEWPLPSRLLHAGDDTIHYIDVGKGPTILFVQAGMWSFIWRDVINQLRATFGCVALDIRGIGAVQRLRRGGSPAVAPAVSWEGPHGTGAAAISRTWPCHEGNRRPRTVHPRSQQPHGGHPNHLRC